MLGPIAREDAVARATANLTNLCARAIGLLVICSVTALCDLVWIGAAVCAIVVILGCADAGGRALGRMPIFIVWPLPLAFLLLALWLAVGVIAGAVVSSAHIVRDVFLVIRDMMQRRTDVSPPGIGDNPTVDSARQVVWRYVKQRGVKKAGPHP